MNKPAMDVVILSRASDDSLQAMTQNTIDTCVAGAGLPVNVIVMEQIPGVTYRQAQTVQAPAEFAYNAFANIGARMGSAPWIMVANNDLVFEPGWLEPLLRAGSAVVSPKDPGHRVQRFLMRNMIGTQVGRTFSGWCFAITRDLWTKIGGFDEDFIFWCADDAVVAQVAARGIMPMLVVASRVRHIISATHSTIPDPNHDRTWAQVWKFEQKYRRRKFIDNPHYIAWKREQGFVR